VAGDDVTITIAANNGQAIRAFRDTQGHLRDMRGRFVTEGAAMSGSMNRLTASIGGVRAAIIPLAAAAVPLAAAMAPVAVKAAAAGVAVAAFGVAVAGQVGYLSDASKAQDKYTQAVQQFGRGSKQAADAQRAVAASLASMPQATARAAVGMQTLKDEFKDWSDSTAKFTMAPVEKSFTVLGQILPKLTPMVQGASSQLDRLVSVAGGAMTTPGFDALTEKVSTFANEALTDAVDGIIHFSRALSEGRAGGPVQAFMEYAKQNGPALRETLSSVGDAVMTLVQAASDAGPGMLTLVNAAAKLVASLPPELVTVAMQVAVGLKMMSLAGAGVAATAAGTGRLRDAMLGLSAASAAAGGGARGARAAFASLSTTVKGGLAAAGIVALALGVGKLAEQSRGAPPDIDKLTTSLKGLAATGKFTGELKTAFGDVKGLVDDIGKIGKAANDQEDYVKSFATSGIKPLDDLRRRFHNLMDDFTDGEDSFKALDGRFKALDTSLASLASSGSSKEAAQGFNMIKKAALDSGKSLGEVEALFPEYSSAVADLKFEQELTTQSMGIFGQASLDTSLKLEAQKQQADGLRASILALNDANRSAYDAQIGFESALDSLSESFAKHGSTLNLDTEAGRANATAMSQAAEARDELIASGLAAGESLGSMTKKSDELRASMLKLATEAFDGNKQKATDYVNTLLGVPSEIKTLVKLEREEAITGLKQVQAEIAKTPGAKKVVVETLNGAAIKALEAVGLKTRQLPDGRTEVRTANGQSLGSIGAVGKALSNLNGKTANTYTTHHVQTYYTYKGKSISEWSAGRMATGGRVRGYANGGSPGGRIDGPGTSTSDSVPAMLSTGEWVIKAAAVDKYGDRFLSMVNDGTLKVGPGYASGGKVTDAMKQARSGLSGQLGISYFGSIAGYSRTPVEKALGAPQDLGALVSSLNQLRGQIKAAFSGSKESSMLKTLDSVGKKLIGYEKQLTAVNKAMESTKAKLADLKSAASSLASGVKGGVLSAANITKGASGGGPMTVASIMGGLTASRDKATAFASALSDLQSMGLNKTLIQQIAEAGIEGGGLETAGALLGASSSEIASLNSLQAQISKAAGSAGKTTADAVYGDAIRAQTVSLTLLQKSQDKLERTMSSLAKTLEKALSEALGGKTAGGIIGAASGGIRSNLTWVGEHGPELLDLPAGSRVWSNPDSRRKAAAPWASMLNTPRRTAAAVGGGGQEVRVVLELRGTSNSRYEEFLLAELRRAINVRGGNVQVVLAGRR
jgi:hypothetical protein